MKIALIAISKHGISIGEKLLPLFPEAVLFLSDKLKNYSNDNTTLYNCPLKEQTTKVFEEFDAIVFFCSTGIAVRMISDCIKSKHTDPAVIVMDDAGHFAISLLSGHKGGANKLTEQISLVTGSIPVITTASDALNKPAIDMLGEKYGWHLNSKRNLTNVGAAIVNDEKVAVLIDSGIAFPELKNNDNLVKVSSFSEIFQYTGGLIISDKEIPEDVMDISVVYRPKRLALGLGCNRNTPLKEFEECVFPTIQQQGFSFDAISFIGTSQIKNDEHGLLEFAKKYNIPIKLYDNDEIKKVAVTSSAMVEKHLGVPGVCEPCAILAADNGMLLIPKTKFKNITVALALRW